MYSYKDQAIALTKHEMIDKQHEAEKLKHFYRISTWTVQVPMALNFICNMHCIISSLMQEIPLDNWRKVHTEH